MKKNIVIIVSVVVLIVIAGGAFYGGMIYGKSQSRPAFSGNFQGLKNNRTDSGGSNFISGDIISKDASSITLQLPGNAGSKIIFYSSATPISKFAAGTADDLATGTSVSVTGATNSDGSVTAQTIQIRPAGQGRPNPIQ